jgi:metal-responsive CopG/Arc/MetJ family transcriptional regulator
VRYTFGMKTAVSVPDEIFQAAERLARRSKTSRSELYSRALDEYLARHSPDEVTETMNRALADIGEQSDRFGRIAARQVLSRAEW